MANIIGLGGSIHDFASCVLTANREIFGIEDERLTRKRYATFSDSPCHASFDYCLKEAKWTREDVDAVVGNDLLLPVRDRLPFRDVIFINHHLSHAYSSFFTSPFREAAVLVVDGAGSPQSKDPGCHVHETATFAHGIDNTISVFSQVFGESSGASYSPELPPLMNNSLGDFYRAITEAIGFGFLNAGKTMGLAPFGDDRYLAQVGQFIRLLPGGQFEISMNQVTGLPGFLRRVRPEASPTEASFRVDAAIAQAGQFWLEALLFHALEYLASKVSSPNLCLVGGVALNSVANGKIGQRTRFKNVHIIFAPGDSGTALGAAVWGALHLGPKHEEPLRLTPSPYCGRRYSTEEVRFALDSSGLSYSRPEQLHRDVALLLSKGSVIAWYEGGSEFGPRALGHRSIFADPRSSSIRDRINSEIKRREWFRPLGPAVRSDSAHRYFQPMAESPFMQFVFPVKEQSRAALAGVTHVDGGSRIQTVQKDTAPALYRLLDEFEAVTGLPMLVNTSFNTKGDPIVETPQQAVEAFVQSGLDGLAISGFLVKRT